MTRLLLYFPSSCDPDVSLIATIRSNFSMCICVCMRRQISLVVVVNVVRYYLKAGIHYMICTTHFKNTSHHTLAVFVNGYRWLKWLKMIEDWVVLKTASSGRITCIVDRRMMNENNMCSKISLKYQTYLCKAKKSWSVSVIHSLLNEGTRKGGGGGGGGCSDTIEEL